MNLNTKVRLLQTTCHLLSIMGFYYMDMTWLVVSLLSWFVLGHLCTIITLHRLLTHRSFKTYPWLENTLIWLSTYSTVGPSISWVALHRMHHGNSDTVNDPHSPYIDGKFNMFKAFEVFIGYDWKIPNIPINYVKDLMRVKLHRFIFDNYFKIIFSTLLVLLLINPWLVLYMYCIPVTLTVISIGLVNVLGHGHGYRNYETKEFSTNSWIASLFTLGEGWHNNHHAHPIRSSNHERWFEFDLNGLIIELIRTDKK